ncbi:MULTISPECIES: hypothetical protein [Legionella]|uniref:Phasin protein n=1 Tax=Legionella drozanskii LLAP-1 TaxID=1212489 RepID=A0A0W0TE54_9GAMM|nr:MULTISPECIES: hypothetical protein [Legionella]KTC93867.1 hypothetical protein Ldro_0217 [Legionella drozanskii LLAP-1]PJE10289.1 MAG: hypothetical protein CK430_10420 [Legionella sp.]
MQRESQRNIEENFNLMSRSAEELMKLNIKTLQSFSFIKPEDLSKLNSPTELMEKTFGIIYENGHKMLNYCEEATEIVGQTVANASNQVKENFSQAKNTAEYVMKEAKANIKKAVF